MQPEADKRLISNAQLETVAYAVQRYYGELLESGARGGFFLGDGAGVGKGRQIAALIKAMWARGTRRILWLSHCNDLREDARRDMVDLGIHVPSSRTDSRHRPGAQTIDVWPAGVGPPPGVRDIASATKQGVFFATYDLLKAGAEIPFDLRARARRDQVRATARAIEDAILTRARQLRIGDAAY